MSTDLYQKGISCPEMPAPNNGVIKSRDGQGVTIECDPGFQLGDATSTRRCIRGAWFPPTEPTCLPIILSGKILMLFSFKLFVLILFFLA